MARSASTSRNNRLRTGFNKIRAGVMDLIETAVDFSIDDALNVAGVTTERAARSRGRPRGRSNARARVTTETVTVGRPTAPTQRRARRATARGRSSTAAINLADLGRGNMLADQVYRNLPAIGQTTTLANLGQGCTLPNGRRPRAQDIGAVVNRFRKAGIVNRGTGPNRNQVTTLRREALAA